MYRAGTGFPGQKVIQAGVIDDREIINGLNMEVELFAPNRVSWVPKLVGTEDFCCISVMIHLIYGEKCLYI
jgi:hypothetical protein